MKKIFFDYSPRLILSALLLTLLSPSCTKPSTNDVLAPVSDEVTFARAGKPTTLPIISLSVTVNDATGYNITSDGKGNYKNGIDKVEAILDQYGTFAFNTNTSTRLAAIRWVTYNFNNPVNLNNTYRPSPSNSKNYHFSTGGSSFGTTPFIPLQNLGINGNPASECIYMGNGIYNSTTSWRVSFHKGIEDVSNSPTAFAVVTRISATEWTVQPLGSCSPTANDNVAALRSGDGSVLYGYYNLPFFFTLTKL